MFSLTKAYNNSFQFTCALIGLHSYGVGVFVLWVLYYWFCAVGVIIIMLAKAALTASCATANIAVETRHLLLVLLWLECRLLLQLRPLCFGFYDYDAISVPLQNVLSKN